MAKPLPPRALRRLSYAAALLNAPTADGGRGMGLPAGQDQDSANLVLGAIMALPEDGKELLKGHVDWVEAYEAASSPSERMGQAAAPLSPPGPVVRSPARQAPTGGPAVTEEPLCEPERDEDDAVLQALASAQEIEFDRPRMGG